MPIVEFGSAGEFIKEMKKIYVKEKEKGRADRYKLTIANGNQKAVFGPTVTTQRVETLLFQGIDEIDAEMIEKAGEEIEVNASVNATHAMSSHADQQQLLDWLQHIKGTKKVILTHGENPSREALAKRITEELGIQDVSLPHLHEQIRI